MTLNKLQKHLSNKPIEYRPGYFHKELANLVSCKDGTTLSVQASETHYCTPRENIGPYSEVEVWSIFPTRLVTEFDYSPEDPSAYVPIEHVVNFIDNHGGMI